MPTRRDFIRFLGASSSIALAGRAGAGPGGPSPGPKPNVILVLTDQWRPSSLEVGPANDNSYAEPGMQTLATPVLKGFGEEGMRLDRCYATKPVCTPNRSAILTGQDPHQTGMFNNNLMLPPDIPCMTDIFKDAGYRTYYLGKWHMDGAGKGTSGAPAAGFIPKNWRRRGLDRVDGMNRGHSYFANSFMLDDEGTVMPVPAANPSGTLDEQLADFEPHRQTDLTLDYPPVLGIPRMFYRVKAESALGGGGGETTDFIEGGDIAGSSTADWSNGAPTAATPGTIGLDITSGTMGAALADAVITQLGGTILVNSGTASSRSLQGTTHYTLVGGTFRRTTNHVLRIGQNTAASDVVFHIVGGLLDVSATAGADGLVFMGTDSVLKVSGGTVDASGGRFQPHNTSKHTDTPILNFEALWAAGRLRFNGANAGPFADVFQVTGDTIALK